MYVIQSPQTYGRQGDWVCERPHAIDAADKFTHETRDIDGKGRSVRSHTYFSRAVSSGWMVKTGDGVEVQGPDDRLGEFLDEIKTGRNLN